MASYGMDYVTRNAQHNLDKSASKTDLVIDPPMHNLISFERLSNECGTSSDFSLFEQPPPEIRQSIKAALDKLKGHHREKLIVPPLPAKGVSKS